MNQHFTINARDAMCSRCGKKESFIHNVSHQERDCWLCTTCVLICHRESFCPTCLAVYKETPPSDAITCYRCHSYSHASCFSSNSASSTSLATSLCSSCKNPRALSFTLKRVTFKGKDQIHRAIDLEAARLLLTAAKIVAISISKEAEAKTKEAWTTTMNTAPVRKAVRNALDNVINNNVDENTTYDDGGSEL